MLAPVFRRVRSSRDVIVNVLAQVGLSAFLQHGILTLRLDLRFFDKRVASLTAVAMAAGLLSLAPISSMADVALRPYEGPAPASSQVQSSSESSCDDGSMGGTFVQRLEDWYGNSFVAACGGGRITSVRFQHLSYGLPGPYLFRLHLVDATCGWVGSTDVLETDPSDTEPGWVEVDTEDRGWCVQGDYQVLLEPLSCMDPLGGEDCFPALAYDATSSTDPAAHCAVVSTQGTFDRACSSARSADGRFFDFVLRPQLQCDDPACSTAVAPASWSLMKSLYH